jgi:hypothetical protein
MSATQTHDLVTGGNMHYPSKLLLAALVATFALAFAVGTATAGRLRTSDIDIYLIWNQLSQRLTLGGELETECNVTLLGHFDSPTITKVKEKKGDIDHAEFAACEPAPSTVLDETLPWEVTYQSFTGRLPNIQSVRLLLIRVAFLVEFGAFAQCLATTTAANPAAGEATIVAGGDVTGFDSDQDETIPLIDLFLGFLCDGQEGTFDGTAEVDNGVGLDIDITLI